MPIPRDTPGTPPADTRTGERIAKLLARAGIASRREVERMIAEGRVARDGKPIETANTVLPSLAGVTVDDRPVGAPAPAQLFLYHKPTGLLVAERDPAGRPTIYDRLPAELPRVIPVGRLDLNTEGLLLLTTDGGLKRQLELPATGVPRTYRARAHGPVTQAQLEELIDGVEIEGVRYGSIDANLERRTGTNVWIELTLTEGKNREVRRVLEHLGLQVGRLIRTRYGPFVLGDLPPGEVGEVRQHDLVAFRQSLAGKRAGPTEDIAPAPLRRPRAERDADDSAPGDRPAVSTSRDRPPTAGRAAAPASPTGRPQAFHSRGAAADPVKQSGSGRPRFGNTTGASARDGTSTRPTSARLGRSGSARDRDGGRDEAPQRAANRANRPAARPERNDSTTRAGARAGARSDETPRRSTASPNAKSGTARPRDEARARPYDRQPATPCGDAAGRPSRPGRSNGKPRGDDAPSRPPSSRAPTSGAPTSGRGNPRPPRSPKPRNR